jgi:hypothetical protein
MTENLQSALSDIFSNLIRKTYQEDRETHFYKLIVSALKSGENPSSAILLLRLEQSRIAKEGALAFFDSGHPLGNFEIVPLFQILPVMFDLANVKEKAISWRGSADRARQKVFDAYMTFLSSKPFSAPVDRMTQFNLAESRAGDLYKTISSYLKKDRKPFVNPPGALECAEIALSRLSRIAHLAVQDVYPDISIDPDIFQILPVIRESEIGGSLLALKEKSAARKKQIEDFFESHTHPRRGIAR